MNTITLQALAIARETLTIEAQAVHAIAQRLDERFVKVVQAVLNCRGRVVAMATWA